MRAHAESGQAGVAVTIAIAVLAVLVGVPAFWITTKEWRRDVTGRAMLAEAVNASKVKTERAKANLESQRLNAQAEVVRARGTAEAVKIEDGSITDSYVDYLYVRNLAKANVIYVPTEAGLPILEAGKR